MRSLTVRSLHIYPIKGIRSVSLSTARVLEEGLAYDRRWVIVGPDNRFITQRENSRLALIDAQIEANGLSLSCDGIAGAIDVDVPSGDVREIITVWRDSVDVAIAVTPVNEWLSNVLNANVRLAFLDKKSSRPISEKWKVNSNVSFADSFPLLIATTASLDHLNDVISKNGGASVPMSRFRPNIVIEGDLPWDEDFWETITIAETEVKLVKPCDRCVVTTLDPSTGQSLGKEPLRSLSIYRKSADPRVEGVLFGWNALATGIDGTIQIGDEVKVLSRRAERWPLSERK